MSDLHKLSGYCSFCEKLKIYSLRNLGFEQLTLPLVHLLLHLY